MENKINKFLKENKKILIIYLIIGLIVYSYIAFNSVYNVDGIDDLIINNKMTNFDMYVSMKRWGWALLGLPFSYYPSPIITLVINIISFSISSLLICKMFDIKDIKYKTLIGILLMAFPYNLNAYSYSPWQYSLGIGVLTSTLSIYLLHNNKNIIYSVLLICFFTSIYQIFLPYALVLAIYSLIIKTKEEKKLKNIFITILKYITVFILGCILYALVSEIFLKVFNVTINTYQNADTMLSFNLSEIIKEFPYTMKDIISINITNFFPYWTHIVLIILLLVSLLFNFKNIEKKRIIIYIILIIGLIISPKILKIFKPYNYYHTITLLPYEMLYVGAIALLFKNINISKYLSKFKRIIYIVVLIVGLTFLINANKLSVMANMATNASFQYINRLETKIESLPMYNNLDNPKKILFLGRINFGDFPSSDAYEFEVGPTSTFINTYTDLWAGLTVLGADYELYNLTISDEEYKEFQKDGLIYGKYPSNTSVYIYKGVIVVKIGDYSIK